MAVSEGEGVHPGGLRSAAWKKCSGQDSKQRGKKEDCAERIVRCGTLSQNGYGTHRVRFARAFRGRVSRRGAEKRGGGASTGLVFIRAPSART